MHIGFDVSQTGANKAGCGFYAHAMVTSMLDQAPDHSYSLYPSFGDYYFDSMMPLWRPYAGKNVRYGPRHLTRASAKAFWNGNDVEHLLGHPDIIHSSNFWCPTQIGSSRLVYTFHDMGFAVDPSWTTETNRVGCFEGVFRSALVADWVVAVSEASKAHYLSVFPHFEPERVRVIYPCSRFKNSQASGRRPRALEGIEGRFWLSVGTIEPRKNQRRLVEAYAEYLARGGAPMPLVLAGGRGWLMEDFRRQLKTLGIDNQTIMTGYVTDDELIWLYRHCFANLYPSLFEGFGLPVLEGMQFGAATVVSNSTSLPEVAGDAAILLDPLNNDSWTTAMLHLAHDQTARDRLAMASLSQASRFSWQQNANKLLDLYQEAINLPKRCSLKMTSADRMKQDEL